MSDWDKPMEDGLNEMLDRRILIKAQAARIAELEAALKPLSCSCTGFCGVMGWLSADNNSCVRRQARVALEGGKR